MGLPCDVPVERSTDFLDQVLDHLLVERVSASQIPRRVALSPRQRRAGGHEFRIGQGRTGGQQRSSDDANEISVTSIAPLPSRRGAAQNSPQSTLAATTQKEPVGDRLLPARYAPRRKLSDFSCSQHTMKATVVKRSGIDPALPPLHGTVPSSECTCTISAAGQRPHGLV
jgi:hypothetical protein